MGWIQLVHKPDIFCHMATFLDILSHRKLLETSKETKLLCSQQRSICQNVIVKYLFIIPGKLVPQYVSSRTKALTIKNCTLFSSFNKENNLWQFTPTCTNLEKLFVTLVEEDQFELLAQMTTLKHLALQFPHIEKLDVKMLGNLHQLETLNIHGSMYDLSFLSKLHMLQTLTVYIWSLSQDSIDVLKSISITKLNVKGGDIDLDTMKQISGNKNLRSLACVLNIHDYYLLQATIDPNLLLVDLTVKIIGGIFDLNALNFIIQTFPNLKTLSLEDTSLNNDDLGLILKSKITDLTIINNRVAVDPREAYWFTNTIEKPISEESVAPLIKHGIKVKISIF